MAEEDLDAKEYLTNAAENAPVLNEKIKEALKMADDTTPPTSEERAKTRERIRKRFDDSELDTVLDQMQEDMVWLLNALKAAEDMIEFYRTQTPSNADKYLVAERDGLVVELAELRGVLNGLKEGGFCWCSGADGHSPQCLKALATLSKPPGTLGKKILEKLDKHKAALAIISIQNVQSSGEWKAAVEFMQEVAEAALET